MLGRPINCQGGGGSNGDWRQEADRVHTFARSTLVGEALPFRVVIMLVPATEHLDRHG